MPRRCLLSLIVAASCFITPIGWRARAATIGDNPFSECERAGLAAEQASGLPPGMLLAIGRVESGRWDTAHSRMAAWPWTIDAAGKGLWFASKDAAAQAVQDLLNSGMRSIDVGCFQINLMWHPTAFANLQQAFDPDANAAYAARFLLALFSQTGSWDAAVEAYHSADPALGFAYRQLVYASWAAAPPPAATGRATPAMLAVAPRPIAIPQVIAGVQIWTPVPVGTASGVVVMPGSPASGGTAALPTVTYRAMPPGLFPAHATSSRARSIGVARYVSSR